MTTHEEVHLDGSVRSLWHPFGGVSDNITRKGEDEDGVLLGDLHHRNVGLGGNGSGEEPLGLVVVGPEGRNGGTCQRRRFREIQDVVQRLPAHTTSVYIYGREQCTYLDRTG